MHHFQYSSGLLHAEDVSLARIAAEVGTPFYCYSTATLVRHYRVLEKAFEGQNALICFAVKANSNQAVLKVMADFYHMDEEGEPLENLRTYADWIVHVQLADTGRKRPGTGSYDYDTFFGYLKEGGYTGAVSIEIADEIPAPDMRRSYEFLRRFWPAG